MKLVEIKLPTEKRTIKQTQHTYRVCGEKGGAGVCVEGRGGAGVGVERRGWAGVCGEKGRSGCVCGGKEWVLCGYNEGEI